MVHLNANLKSAWTAHYSTLYNKHLEKHILKQINQLGRSRTEIRTVTFFVIGSMYFGLILTKEGRRI